MLSKKRKFFEIESSSKNKRKSNIEIDSQQRKFLKLNKKSEPRLKEYICFKHEHQIETCYIYDCDGEKKYKHLKIQEELTKYYLL